MFVDKEQDGLKLGSGVYASHTEEIYGELFNNQVTVYTMKQSLNSGMNVPSKPVVKPRAFPYISRDSLREKNNRTEGG